MYKVKDISGDTIIKDVDMSSRVVTGYFSTFDFKDSDGDVIRRGAYSKTVAENGPKSSRPRIMHLYQHDTRSPIGLLLELREDANGLYFESKISESTLGNDVLTMYNEKILKEHSVGMNVIDANQKDDFWEITEVKLWEGSTVTWGANEMATGGNMKSMSLPEVASLREKLNAWKNVLRKGNLSDETCNCLAIQIAQTESYIKSLEAEQSRQADKEFLSELKSIIKFKN